MCPDGDKTPHQCFSVLFPDEDTSMRLPRQSCTPSGVWRCCNGKRYNSRVYRCCYGHAIYLPHCYRGCLRPVICGDKAYSPLLGMACCHLGYNKYKVYRQDLKQCCYGRLISSRERCLPTCGGRTYVPPTQRCCGTKIYWSSFYKCCYGRSSHTVYVCQSCPHGQVLGWEIPPKQ